MHFIESVELRNRLDNYLAAQPLPGLRTRASRERFVQNLVESQKKLRALAVGRFKGTTDPSKKGFHPLKAMVEHFRAGNANEAVWLAFLTTHFGQDVPETVRRFYGKFERGQWSWKAVREDPASVRDWMQENWPKLQKLKFGNHRKRRIMNPYHPRGTAAVIVSFVQWVERHGYGSPYEAFRAVPGEAQTSEAAFECLYENLKVRDFGRTARFDLLCLLGNLGILPISPGHCYLRSATGPKTGAILMVTGKRKGSLTPEVEQRIKALQKWLGIPVEAMEDALCNWQKGLEKGYLSVACG